MNISPISGYNTNTEYTPQFKGKILHNEAYEFLSKRFRYGLSTYAVDIKKLLGLKPMKPIFGEKLKPYEQAIEKIDDGNVYSVELLDCFPSSFPSQPYISAGIFKNEQMIGHEFSNYNLHKIESALIKQLITDYPQLAEIASRVDRFERMG